MQWQRIFAEKFNHCPEVMTLTQRRFHGSLTINFSDGVPHTFKLEQHFKAKDNKKFSNLAQGISQVAAFYDKTYQPKPQEVK